MGPSFLLQNDIERVQAILRGIIEQTFLVGHIRGLLD